mmetsp:Transcript_6744/g.9825  ORF Transcript_6744/g.9825 Transcript_6744/m.9825 type:complete len:133 (-) Transcript_6744:1000-1398(-)
MDAYIMCRGHRTHYLYSYWILLFSSFSQTTYFYQHNNVHYNTITITKLKVKVDMPASKAKQDPTVDPEGSEESSLVALIIGGLTGLTSKVDGQKSSSACIDSTIEEVADSPPSGTSGSPSLPSNKTKSSFSS